ncbi:MAG: MFS transporter, partial [Rhodospirillales bacterium]
AVFALNSAIHSFLILAFSSSSRVTMDVGFYYMSNAAGRLAGTLLSGLSFQFGGLSLCLLTAFAMCGFSWAMAARMTMKFSD